MENAFEKKYGIKVGDTVYLTTKDGKFAGVPLNYLGCTKGEITFSFDADGIRTPCIYKRSIEEVINNLDNVTKINLEIQK